MARAKSVILSAEDKKSMASDLKPRIKAAKAEVSEILKAAKATEKEYTQQMRVHDKNLAAANKTLAKLEAELSAVSSPAS